MLLTVYVRDSKTLRKFLKFESLAYILRLGASKARRSLIRLLSNIYLYFAFFSLQRLGSGRDRHVMYQLGADAVY